MGGYQEVRITPTRKVISLPARATQTPVSALPGVLVLADRSKQCSHQRPVQKHVLQLARLRRSEHRRFPAFRNAMTRRAPQLLTVGEQLRVHTPDVAKPNERNGLS